MGINNRNPYKEVVLNIAGKPWLEALGGGAENYTKYFAPDLHLYLDKGVSYTVKTKYTNVLKNLTEKFKAGTTVSKIMGAVQKLSDVTSVLDQYANQRRQSQSGGASTSPSGPTIDQKDAKADALRKLRILPPNVRFQTRLQNLPAWETTDPFEIESFKFKFYLGMAGEWNARTEVYNPAVALARVNQPIDMGGYLKGPLPNTAWVYATIGVSVAESVTGVARSMFESRVTSAGSATGDVDARAEIDFEKKLSEVIGKVEDKLNTSINTWPGMGNIDVKIGRLSIPKMIVGNTSVKFSQDTDQNGFPIWAEVEWTSIESLEMATTSKFPLIGTRDGQVSQIEEYNVTSEAQSIVDTGNLGGFLNEQG